MDTNLLIGRNFDTKKGKIFYGYIEAWTFQKKADAGKPLFEKRTVKGTDGDNTLVTMSVTTKLHPKTADFYFKLNIKEGDTVFITVNAWNKEAEILEKYNPTTGQLLGLCGAIQLQKYNGTDGNEHSKLVMNLDGFKAITKKHTNEATSEQKPEVPDNEDIPF